MRLLICGAGAMGCLFGGLLTRAGGEVWLLSHWTEHLARLRREGLLLHALDGTVQQLAVRTVAYDELPPARFDVAFISVKSHATSEAAAWAARALAPTGVAITMQNGLGNRERLAEAVGAQRALLGVTAHGATLLGPGEVRHAGRGPTVVAAEPHEAAARRIAALLSQAGIETTVEAAIEPLIWNKLLVNVGINALTAILDVPNGDLARLEPARQLLGQAVEEAVQVAAARGIALAPDAVGRALAVAAATARNVSSMRADVRRGAATEIGVLNGAIVREGERLGIPTPVNRTLVALVQALEAKGVARTDDPAA